MSPAPGQADFEVAWWVYAGIAGLLLIYGGTFVLYVKLVDRFRNRF